MPDSPPIFPQWLDFDPLCHNERLSMDEPALVELHRLGLNRGGLDHLHGRFYAATSASPTHLAWFVVSGRIRAVSGDQTFRLGSGEGFLSPAGASHSVELLSPKAEGCWFHFRTEPHWDHFTPQSHRVNRERLQLLQSSMGQLIAETDRRAPFREEMMERLAGVIAITLQREMHAVIANRATAIQERRLELLWEKIRGSLAEPWTVERLAAQIHVSSSYLHKLVMRCHSVPPMEKVTLLRMESAKGLLENTDFTLDEIATRTGYASAYAFSNAFQRITGERPGNFRTRMSQWNSPSVPPTATNLPHSH